MQENSKLEKLYFSSTGMKHIAAECRSKRTCQTCKGEHHSSLCKQSNAIMVAIQVSVVCPVVVVKVNNIICRVLLVTGAGSSFTSSASLETLNIQSVGKDTKRTND